MLVKTNLLANLLKIPFRSIQKSSVVTGELLAAEDLSRIVQDDEWNNAMSYDTIPGPKPIPIFGNRWRAMPFIGNYNTYHMDVACKNLYDFYGPIVKVTKFFQNADMVMVFEADDIEKLLRNQEHLPDRPPIHTLMYYKTVLRKDFFGDNLGVIGIGVDHWMKFRPKIQKEMLQPKIVKLYIGDIEKLTAEFVDRVATIRDHKDEVPGDFFKEISKWALECIANITLDTRLGCLDNDPPEQAKAFLESMKTIMSCTTILEFKIPFWRLFSTPVWRKYVKALDTFHSIIINNVNDAIIRGVGNKPPEEWSILQRMLASNPDDPGVVSVMAFDMFLVGIDTSSSAVSSVLYELSKHPEIQEKIYDEIKNVLPTNDTPLTSAKLESMHYLKASIKEVLRLVPPLIGNGRILSTDLVLSGYQIPKGTHVVFQGLVSSRSEKHYKNSEEFIPDRWMKREGQCPFSKDNSEISEKYHPFSNIPFGFGKRMCLGKRFADLLIQIVICKLVQKYRVEYNYGKLDYVTGPLYSLEGPLKFKFSERE